MLLLDNSAWAHLIRGGLGRERTQTIATWIERGSIAACLPFLLEAGYSARSFADHRNLMADLVALPRAEITPAVERLAVEAQGELAKIGHHRLAPTDLIIAACAHEAGAGVLHYDRDYDLIAKHTGLDFESEWVAPAGTLA
ncbi:MAG TPA: PIN domain-containing protein [Solirubrobacteraceae bacterium]